jgi:hypothetical protein
VQIASTAGTLAGTGAGIGEVFHSV